MLLAVQSNGRPTDLTNFIPQKVICFAAAAVLVMIASFGALAQSTPPKVTQIDIPGLRRLVRPQGKPLLVNFWATWCVPCREEYPDLVKIDQEYRGKIDFVTVSLDEVADKDTLVLQFLSEMKAQMPPYLLVTDNEEAAMAVVSKDWTGGLPFTILFDAKGGIAYSRQGKVKIDLLKAALVKTAPAGSVASPTNR
jgi:thiol-disulfide isomerase/thioredoxin